MKILMIMLSGVMVSNQIDKTQLESITNTQVVEQYKIIPSEIIQLRKAKNVQIKVVANKKATKKKVVKKAKKKVVKKKKVIKKYNSIKKKTSKKKYVKVPKRIRYNVGEIQSYAHQLVLEYGWTEEDYQALVSLWYRESGWNPNAVNKKSGACGIPQSLPCSKMKSESSDYRTNYKTQVRWGLKYIKARYGSPSNAWGHSKRKGWY